MDRNFYDNNDFEDLLKQKTDLHKMYPSDRVWKNIYYSLHGRKRWTALVITLLFITSGSLFIGRQALLSNYTRMATQLNKNPETLMSAPGKATHHMQQYIVSGKMTDTHQLTPAQKIPLASTGAGTTKTAFVTQYGTDLSDRPATAKTDINNAVTANTETRILVIENSTVSDTAKILAEANRKKSALPVNDKKADPAFQHPAAVVIAKPSRWFVQFYASPMKSYRRLSTKDQAGYNSPVSAIYAGNINQYVHHKPAAGIEAGGKIIYKLSGNLSIYAGAQLNYSRYYIDAYKYQPERASIALNNARSADTLSGYTDIRNFSGYSPEQLQNKYWQLSIPVGLEIKLLGDRKLQFNIAGGFQPTFLINSKAYLISSDYKNYLQSPDLARSFNVHTNFEAFFSYQAKGFKWQLGPQFRSQLLSSYSNQYRVREYLTEFGIKLGITKTIR